MSAFISTARFVVGEISNSKDEIIATVYDEEALAVMAAAPELLEALKGVLRVADRKTDEFDAARAAIRKATGQEEPK